MIKKVIKTLRPFVLGHTIVICAVLSVLAGFNTIKAFCAILSVLLVHALAQLSNMIHDIELDKINPHKRRRPTVTGEINLFRAKILCIAMFIVAVIFAYQVSTGFLARLMILCGLSLMFSLSYITRRNAISHAVMMALCRGFLPPFVFLGDRGIYIAILFFIWCLAFNVAKDVKDVEADRKFNIKTIAQYGKKKLKTWMYFWATVFYIYVLILSFMINRKLIFMMITIPYALTIPETLDLPPAYSDNNLAYDSYWWGLTINYVMLLLLL